MTLSSTCVNNIPDQNLTNVNKLRVIAEHFSEIDSTQTYLHEQKLPELENSKCMDTLYIVSADHQTRGMGKGDRRWWSDKASKSLAVSFMFLVPVSGRVPFITQILALSATEVLSMCCIKWPNDLMVSGKKIGGILAKLVPLHDNVGAMIIGIGININTPDDVLAQSVPEAQWLPSSVSVDPDALRAAIINRFTHNLSLYLMGSEQKNWIELVSHKQYMYGSEIEFVASPSVTIRGEHRGLSPEGGLVISDQHQEHVFFSGEIRPTTREHTSGASV